jgi:hypothetical protein
MDGDVTIDDHRERKWVIVKRLVVSLRGKE